MGAHADYSVGGTIREEQRLSNIYIKDLEPIGGWSIVFMGRGGQEIIRLEKNGDIHVNGKLIENDTEVVEGMRDLINQNNIMREELNNGR